MARGEFISRMPHVEQKAGTKKNLIELQKRGVRESNVRKCPGSKNPFPKNPINDVITTR